MAEKLVVFDPTVEPVGETFKLAPRAGGLTGKVIGLLDNGKHNSDRLLKQVADLLIREYGVKQVVTQKKPSAFRPAPDEQLDALAQSCDLAVAGIGD